MRCNRLIGALVALAAIAGACGDRGPDPSHAVTFPDGVPTPSTTVPSTDATVPSADATVPVPPVVTEPAGPGPGDFGTLFDVCGPNEGGGSIPDLAEDEIQGLTGDTIKLATIADPGFQGSPGLNQEIFDTGEAFVAWCNELGGINGKQIELSLRDAKLTDYQPVLEQACREDFAVVGDGAVQDNLWELVGVPCGLIDVAGFSVTNEKAGLVGDDPVTRRQVQPVPNAADEYPTGAFLLVDDAFPGARDRTGFVYADFQTLVQQYTKERAALEQIGHVVTHTGIYNVLGEDNWTPFAAAIRSDEVELLKFIGEPDNGAQLKVALAEVGYSPTVTLNETNFYDPNYLIAGGDAVEGDFVRTVFWPFEEADRNPATRTYLDLLEAQGGKVATLGVQSMSAWLLFATLAKECDLADNLSRSCILEAAAEVTEWDAGGLHAPTSPATNEGSDCVIVLQVQDGAFVRWAPDIVTGYACDPSYRVTVAPPG